MKSARILPVSETGSFLVRTSAAGKDQTKKNQADDDNDFDGGEPEFKFPKESDSEVVDDDDCNQEDGNEDSRIHFRAGNPELDNE